MVTSSNSDNLDRCQLINKNKINRNQKQQVIKIKKTNQKEKKTIFEFHFKCDLSEFRKKMIENKRLQIMIIQFGFIAITIIISIVNGQTTIPPKQCCPENTIMTKSCIHPNGHKTPIQLICEIGKYKLDPLENPEHDQYHINSNGDMHYGSDTSEIIPWDRYCETNNFRPVNGSRNEARTVALVCFLESHQPQFFLFAIKGSLALISVLFLGLTLYIYWILPDMRETQDKVTCVAVFCLMIFLMFLGILQMASDKLLTACAPFGYIVYFFTISYFTWLNLIMLNVWKASVLPKWNVKEQTWYIWNHVYGWTIPIILIGIVLLCDHLEGGFAPGIGGESCWFADKRESWIFLYLPISISLGLNLILFLWSIWGLHKNGIDISSDRKRATAYKIKLYLKLFILAGLNWALEILSYHYGSDFNQEWFWIVVDVCNALHGVLIFFVLIVFRRRVRHELAGKRILCCTGPERWSNAQYDEEERLRDHDHDDNNKYNLTITKQG